MVIADRLRELRDQKRLSQVDIEKRAGLRCCYISRVEHGHTVPAVETLEKFARALEVPVYQLFYDGEEVAKLSNLPKRKTTDITWGNSGEEARLLVRFRHLFSRMHESDLRVLLALAQKMARPKGV